MSDRELVVRPVSSDADWETARAIRTVVFIEEQRCAPEEEWDGFDESSRHLLAWLGDEAIGVARWRAVPHGGRAVAKLERFAILRDYRGRGFGRQLILQTMDDARLGGFDEYLVHAQTYLEDLYLDLGFVRIGETFVEADLPHVCMVFELGGRTGDGNNGQAGS
jgi:predicted GNAT family N-acyltransferase